MEKKEPIYSFIWKQPKNRQKNTKAMVFRHWIIRQWRILIPEVWETNEVNPMVVPAHCLGVVSSLGTKKNPEGAPRSPWVEEIKLGVQRGKELEFTGQSTEVLKCKKLHKGRILETTEGPPRVYSAVMINMCMWGSYLRLRNHPKGFEGTVPKTHTGLGVLPAHQTDWKAS